MNVNLTSPISIDVTTAKLIVEDGNQGTIEFTLLGQPVRLYIASSDYSYITNIVVGDRIILLQSFGGFDINSSGIVQAIIPSITDDQVTVCFDQVYPDKIVDPVQANIVSSKPTIFMQVPLRLIQKI
jgi:hypothetical protein